MPVTHSAKATNNNGVSLGLRLTLLTTLLTGATLVLFAITFYQVLQATLRRQIDTQLETRALLFTRALTPTTSVAGAQALSLPVPLEEFAVPGIYAEVVASDGTVHAASPNLPGGRLPLAATVLADAHAGKGIRGTAMVSNTEQLRFLAQPLRGQPDRVLVVAESLQPLLRTLQGIRVVLLAGVGMSLLLAGGGATLLTARALAPIRQLTQTASQVALTGRYDTRVPLPHRQDEIGQLATTINTLITTVEQTLIQQRQFLADTSHELRSPLTVVLGNLHLLQRNLDPHERDLSVQEATAEAQRMRRLVNDLLLLAQADAHQVIAQAPVRLDHVVQETAATIARQTQDHTISLDIGAPVRIIGDAERLTQLMRNLLENAIQHTPPGTAVMVQLQQRDGWAVVTVADNGPGIPADHLSHIWERFYRLDKTRTRASGNSGLGLAIVKYIAEAHAGSVDVYSSIDAGTTFAVQLPLG
ncbi:MAG: HAMP domain-containing protein [Herpetosiphonaceae bacterium]|nr:HAMP domain-containing protein [Herpetosiphonaceae bacterium]